MRGLIWTILTVGLVTATAMAQEPSGAAVRLGPGPAAEVSRGPVPRPPGPPGPGSARILPGNGSIVFERIHIDPKKREISLPCSVNMDQGLLEYGLVGVRGKRHESLLVTDVDPYNLQVALLLLGLQGKEALQFQGDPTPPEGSPVRITVEWREGGEVHEMRLEEFVQNRNTQAAMVETDWVFTGSRFWNGRFMAQVDGSLVALYRDPAALINNPLPDGSNDRIWFADPTKTPAVGTRMLLRIRALAP